jgi:hypothetical protein
MAAEFASEFAGEFAGEFASEFPAEFFGDFDGDFDAGEVVAGVGLTAFLWFAATVAAECVSAFPPA